MVTAEYKIAYSEVLEILKYISKEEYDKIPQNMIELFETNASKENEFIYNPSKTLQEQNVSETTRTIIAILFRNYWASEEQRIKIKSVQEKERLNQINVNDVFNRNKYEKDSNSEENITNNLPVVVKEEKLYKKIINFIKKIFHIKN